MVCIKLVVYLINKKGMNCMDEISGRELIEYISEHKEEIRLYDKQADLILEQLHQEGFMLIAKDNNLVLAFDDQHGHIEKIITADELIQMVCDMNYRKLEETKASLKKNNSQLTETCKQLYDVCKLTHKSQILADAYNQTDSAKEIQKILNRKQSEKKSKIR